MMEAFYNALQKPWFAPPVWLFLPVWTAIYAIMAVTYLRIFYLAFRRVVPLWIVMPFALNLICNFAYIPLEFQLGNDYLALLDILAVLFTIAWGMASIWPYSRTLAYWQIPYVAWVAYATVLQISITYLNM